MESALLDSIAKFRINPKFVKEVDYDTWWYYVTNVGYGFQDGNFSVLYGLNKEKEKGTATVYRYEYIGEYASYKTSVKSDFSFLVKSYRKCWIVVNPAYTVIGGKIM